MAFLCLDHLVIGAATLQQGVDWCRAALGVEPGPGGVHPLFGTHNRLLRLDGDAPSPAYVEIIAIDPDAPAPGRARWFGLDEVDLSDGPRLLTWVGRTPMLEMHRGGLITAGQSPGDPVTASRETPQGTLRWQICVPADGRLRHGGALPTLIQWHSAHPTDAMAPSGLQLQSLTVNRLPAQTLDVLQLRGVRARDDVGPAVCAVLRTPRGEITLESR